MKTNLLSIILILIWGTGQSQPAQENSLLYRVTGNGLDHPSYVYGTIHLLCPEDLSFSPEVKESIAGSSQLIFELDFDDPNLMTDLQSGLMLSDGQTLKSLYTEEEYAILNRYTLENFGQPADMMGTMKPFFLMSMMYPKILGCAPASMEMELMNMADKNKTEVMGIETVQEQLAAIDALSVEDQADMLLEAMEDFDEQRENLLALLELYKSEDVEALYASSSEDFAEYDGFDEIMLTNRNKNWIDRMEKLMKKEQSFFAVGAAHLGGESGVLQLLENEGYTVTPVISTLEEAKEMSTAALGETARQLIGTWKIHESHIEEITDDAIENAVAQNPQMKAQIEGQRNVIAEMVMNTIKEFRADGTYRIVVPGAGMNQSGTWRVDEENGILIEADASGEESVKDIREINEEILVTQKGEETPRKYVRSE